MADILIVGYGNELRGDDGLGPFVAECIAAAKIPGVRVLTTLQLLPELAADLAEVRLVVFVDALTGQEAEDRPRLKRITARTTFDWNTHFSDPQGLLALALALNGAVPESWWAIVPGQDFSHREGLSPAAQENAQRTFDILARFLRSWRPGCQ